MVKSSIHARPRLSDFATCTSVFAVREVENENKESLQLYSLLLHHVLNSAKHSCCRLDVKTTGVERLRDNVI